MVAKNKQNSKATLTNETMMALAGFDQRDAHNGNDVFSNMRSGSSWLDSPFYTCLTWRQWRTCISWARDCVNINWGLELLEHTTYGAYNSVVTVHVQNDAPATRCELSLYYKKKTRQDHDTPWSANKNLIQIRSGTTIHHSTEFTSALPMLEAGKCAPRRAQSTRRLQPTTTPADPMRRGHFGAKKTGDGAKDSCWCVLLHPFSRQQQCYNCWSGSSGVGAGS